ncbi:hypothetical protein RD792_011327 [Penstemon davidsonii]|uniref:Zinc finger PHD-type domain-containing protein n=1 Tax=Penstemon davidsonii TaxID=160366 RepID=A0ABR0D499_9LAMI|nr:hypothetical protein RD792_011327 [Penstemon davidsonii]
MSQLDLSGCKKRKRGERVFKFTMFGERGYPAEFNGSFQENVRALLDFGQVENGVCGAMASWSFHLEVRRHPLMELFMFVVEEPIELSLEVHCKQCHYIGENCKSNVNIELYRDQGHSMHGVFHSNGFGHLLCINGSEFGSDLAGYQIMEFWDRLCSGLGARKVSLKDVAEKRGMDLRLLHAVAYSKPWFGHWDYKFGRGSFNINQEMYQSAIKAIRNIPINLLAHQLGFGSSKNETQIVLSRYQVLSGHSLITLGDLFHFMFELRFRLAKENNSKDSHYPGIMSDTSCRWSPKRVELAIHVVVEALKRAESRWVSRQHVRDVARAYIGDTGLLDFVLKSLGNHIVGKYFVRRCLNPVTKVLEYCLEDISRSLPKQEAYPMDHNSEGKLKISWTQLMKDIFCLNKHIFREKDKRTTNDGVLATVQVASQIILDSKYLVKEYCDEITPNDDDDMNKKTVYCALILAYNIVTPYHCFVLKSNATFDELKYEVEKTFRETYFGLSNFVVMSIENIYPHGSDLVFKTVKPDSKIVIKYDQGDININEGLLIGINNDLIVDCICGTKDDDGERMISCDICQVWQHTRCVEIQDEDEIPIIFICNTCEQELSRLPTNLP